MYLDDIFPFDLSDKEQASYFGHLNKELTNIVLNYLKLNHNRVYDVNYGDTYFIFKGNKNSVISFKIKGLRNWLFGIWVHSELLFDSDQLDKPVIELFCQHEHLIDKFKPSRSYFLVNWTVSKFKDWLNGEQDIRYTIFGSDCLNLIEHIKDHPIYSYKESDDYHNWIVGSCFKYYIKNEIAYYKPAYVEKFYWKLLIPYINHVIRRFKSYKQVEKAYIQQFGNNWISNPRIRVVIKFKLEVSDDEASDIIFEVLPFTHFERLFKIDNYEYMLSFIFEVGEDEYLSFE